VAENEDEDHQSVVDRALSAEMQDSYMQYAMSVIKSRALPDVRDGMKPSQRRVIYAMAHNLNLLPSKQRVKSARVVGETMGRYHPHGDSAIYMTLVRLAQDFASRYVLIDRKGNFGSIAMPSPAAMRYTECRMAPAAVDMVADIDQDTVEMDDNYDGTTVEPKVLPSRFPNLLCNGSQGIAVGMATSIPPHNLFEVCDALEALVKNPDLPNSKLFELIPGPDFPTGGQICGVGGIRQAYQTGRGHLTLRGKHHIEDKGRSQQIVVTQLPYQVTTETLIEKVQAAFSQNKIDGLSGLKDQTARGKIRLVFQCKQGEDPEVVLNQLYKYTPLQTTFSIIMIALDENGTKPRTFTLRGLLQAYIDHRFEVVRRRTRFQLDKARARIHILHGLQAALDHIDAVIKLIRNAQSTEEARNEIRGLLKTPSADGELRPITERQANAILDMRLQQLTGLSRDNLIAELKEKEDLAADLRDILSRHERVVGIFEEELATLRTNYAKKRSNDRVTYTTERLTEIQVGEVGDIDIEDLIADDTAIVTVTHKGYIKRTELSAYRLQKRDGKGLYGANTKGDDFVTEIFQAGTKDFLLCFTDHGRVHWVKVYKIPEGGRTARGRGLRNLIALLPEEQVTSLIPISGEFRDDRFLVMATAQGIIKKTSLSAFKRPKKGGIIAVKLDEGDKLISVRVTNGERELMLATRQGKAIRFHENTVRAMGRVSRGVKGITLAETDEVEAMVVVGEDGNQLLTVCELGYGKRTPVEDYRETNRGGKGIINIKTTARNGLVVSARAVNDDDQVMLITSAGKLIRSEVKGISLIGRSTQGVRLIKIDGDERVVAVAKVQSEDDDGVDGDGEDE